MRYLLSILLCLVASCAGAYTNGFIGAVASGGGVVVDYIRYPTGQGALNNWTASGAATKWAAVDDPAGSPDDATTYIYRADTAASESFDYAAFSIPEGTAISGVAVRYRCKNALSGTTGVRARLYVNGTLYNAPYDPDVTSSYANYSYTWATNPNTASAWTVSDVNGTSAAPLQDFAIEARGMATGEMVECTQTYIEVIHP